jgi:hypothetical protein
LFSTSISCYSVGLLGGTLRLLLSPSLAILCAVCAGKLDNGAGQVGRAEQPLSVLGVEIHLTPGASGPWCSETFLFLDPEGLKSLGKGAIIRTMQNLEEPFESCKLQFVMNLKH